MTWETHKPGVTRLYGEHHRVTVARSLMGGWLWTVDRCRRGRTKEMAHGRVGTRGAAREVGSVVMSTLDDRVTL